MASNSPTATGSDLSIWRFNLICSALNVFIISSAALGQQSPQQPLGQQVQAGLQQQQGFQQRISQQPAPKAPFELTPQESANMDAILGKWESQSQSVKTLEASFQKWKYDIAAAPAGKVATVSSGTIRYMNPDQGHFKEERILFFKGVDAQGKDQHAEVPGRFGEWWVCTGKELVFLNRDKKEKVIETLPANLQGEQLFDSPLPFVFNLKAQRLKDRFWIRRINPPNNQQGTYWLEAWPKTQKDAQLYKLVQIVVDAKTFLPNALLIYPPNYDAQSAPNREIYEFKDVKINHIGTNALQKLFQGQFIDPNPGEAGWKEIRNPSVPNQGIPVAQQPQENGKPR